MEEISCYPLMRKSCWLSAVSAKMETISTWAPHCELITPVETSVTTENSNIAAAKVANQIDGI